MSELTLKEAAQLRAAQEEAEAEAAFEYFRARDRQRGLELIADGADEAEVDALAARIDNPDYGIRRIPGGWEQYPLKPPQPEPESEEDIEAAIEFLKQKL